MSSWTIFAYISRIFHLVWLYSMSLFSTKWSVDSQPCDIEAGIPTILIKVPAVVPNDHREVDVETDYLESIPNPFLDRHSSITSKGHYNTTNEPESVCPVRRPSRRHSMIVPLKSRIVDATSKNIQDITQDKIKSVTVTYGPVVAVACSAQIEYFEDYIASTANIEWFDSSLHQPSYAPEIIYPEAHIPSSAKIEYFDSSPHQPSYVQEIIYPEAHIPSSAKIEYFDSDVAENEESSFFISSESAGFSSIELSSAETGFEFPLVADSILANPALNSPQNCVVQNHDIAFTSLPDLPTIVTFAQDVENASFAGITHRTSDPPSFMATSSMDSVAGRVLIKGGLKYSHRRYSTCNSSMSLSLKTSATNTTDFDVDTITPSSQSRTRIQEGIRYSHRRYSTWNSSNESSCSISESTYRPEVWNETESPQSTATPVAETPDAQLPSLFVLDGTEFVEDSAESWSSQCVGAMDAVGTSVSSEMELEPDVSEITVTRPKHFRNSVERVEYLKAQLDACFEAAYKKAGIPWTPTPEFCESPQSDTDSLCSESDGGIRTCD